MMKKLVVLLACFGLALHLTGCSLFSSENKSDAEVAADVDSADLEKLEGDDGLQTADNSLASDQLPEDALGETTPKAEPESIAAAPAAPATPAAPAPSQANNETLPADPFAEHSATEVPPPAAADANTTVVDSGVTTNPETTPMVESTTKTQASAATTEESAPKKPAASLQKVATAPWKVGKTWFNTVYFARPGDSLASISQMIYGADKTAELKKGNVALKNRAVKPGDKVYYNSPHRPDDSSKMITYYEDNGMAPEVYVAKSGDNIRKISKKLLGYSNAWKEVWATNAVESKDAIPEGTELHFWKGGAVAAAPSAPAPAPHEDVAAAPAQPPHAEPPAVPPQQAQAEIPPPPPMPEAQPPAAEMAPPPPPPAEVAQNQQMAPPPPPPPVEAVNPPPPPPVMGKKQAHHVEEAPAGGMDNDTTLALAVVGLAAAGLAGLIVIRKKRKQKEAEQQAMDQTHVGT